MCMRVPKKEYFDQNYNGNNEIFFLTIFNHFFIYHSFVEWYVRTCCNLKRISNNRYNQIIAEIDTILEDFKIHCHLLLHQSLYFVERREGVNISE